MYIPDLAKASVLNFFRLTTGRRYPTGALAQKLSPSQYRPDFMILARWQSIPARRANYSDLNRRTDYGLESNITALGTYCSINPCRKLDIRFRPRRPLCPHCRHCRSYAELPRWVNSGPSAAPPRRSVPEGRADLNTAKADIGQRMSDVGGRADLDRNVWNFAF